MKIAVTYSGTESEDIHIIDTDLLPYEFAQNMIKWLPFHENFADEGITLSMYDKLDLAEIKEFPCTIDGWLCLYGD